VHDAEESDVHPIEGELRRFTNVPPASAVIYRRQCTLAPHGFPLIGLRPRADDAGRRCELKKNLAIPIDEADISPGGCGQLVLFIAFT
jgi:hypothetical protein